MAQNASRPVTQTVKSTFGHIVSSKYRSNYDFGIPMFAHQTGFATAVLWNSKNSIIRIVPGYDPETGKVFRQNINVLDYAEDASPLEYLSDSFFCADVVYGFGERRQTFISNYRPGSPEEQAYGGDTVITWIIKDILNSTRTGENAKQLYQGIPDWFEWTNYKLKHWVASPKTTLMCQALTFLVNDRPSARWDNEAKVSIPLEDPDGNPLPLMSVVLFSGPKTLTAVMTGLTAPSDPGKALDAATNNKLGAMAECQGNKLFLNSVFDTESKKDKQTYLKPSVQPLTAKGWTKTPYPIAEEFVKKLWVPWDQLIEYKTPEEQIRIAASELGADTVNYLFEVDKTHFKGLTVPQDIAAAGLGRYREQAKNGGRYDRIVAPKVNTPIQSHEDLPEEYIRRPLNLRDTPAPIAAGATPSASKGLAGLSETADMDIDKILERSKQLTQATKRTTALNKEQLDMQAANARALLGDDDDSDIEDAIVEDIDPSKYGL